MPVQRKQYNLKLFWDFKLFWDRFPEYNDIVLFGRVDRLDHNAGPEYGLIAVL